jgi:hypothetical protein
MRVNLLKSGGTGTAVYKRYGISHNYMTSDVVIIDGMFLEIIKYYNKNKNGKYLVAFALEEKDKPGHYSVYEVLD